jgi:hypothetical protein
LLAGFVLLLAMIFLDSPPAMHSELFLEYWTRAVPRRLIPWQDWAFAASWFAVPALLWLAAWLALREREIAR